MLPCGVTQLAFDLVEPFALRVERSAVEVVEQSQVADAMWELAGAEFHCLEVAVAGVDLRAEAAEAGEHGGVVGEVGSQEFDGGLVLYPRHRGRLREPFGEGVAALVGELVVGAIAGAPWLLLGV